MLVLEDLQHAQARGAKIYAEIIGYGATSDGANMVAPSGEGAVRCMHQAIATVDAPIDYINTHGTSTELGDIAELDAMRETFGDAVPPFSSSKSLCGHSLGAAGVQEAIHCLLMLEQDFMAGSANISDLDARAEGMPVLLQSRENAGLNTVMSNNFGFGGTNAGIVFQRFSG
jgi:3-oxoacyl-[acyl-carrier-protein] synthase-1